ncbi:MAG: hypothetical protein IJZ39_08090 [Oscillospiraceae bacterium]|nr:hypothetical protein [Oscillospiraceae bacterium]
MKTYLYPQNLRARANLWLWSLRDFLILCIAVLISAVILLNSGVMLPAAMALSYGFLTIRRDDTAVVDFIGYAVRYFLTGQQYFEWGRT